MQNFGGADLVVTKTGGGSFTLDSFDLADCRNTGEVGVIAFGYTGVTSFSLRHVALFQLDNVTVNSVPEPGTYALVAVGLLASGFAARRKAGKFRDWVGFELMVLGLAARRETRYAPR